MIDPIDLLLAEHRHLRIEIERLRGAVAELEARGDAALPVAMPALRAVVSMMAGPLLVHARKEDDALFPAVERALGEAEGPTGVMRREHVEIHDRARRFRETLRQLHDEEHPAIVAGGERLRGLARRGAGAAALTATGAEVVDLLDAHFEKEEDVLFPIARNLLTSEDLAAVAARMEEIEKEGVR